MWNNSEYDGYGASTTSTFGGSGAGGFMNSAGANSSQNKKMNRQNNIVPCTCAEILTSTQQDDRFITQGGLEISQVVVIGVIRSVNESATRLDYELDDYTGPYLSIKQFVDNDDSVPDSERIRPFREMTYVKIFGHVRNLQGSRNIAAFKVVKLTDLNELTSHLLEVIYTRMLHAKKGSGDTAAGNASMGVSGAGATGGAAAGGALCGLKTLQAQIQNSVRAYMGEEGISVGQLCDQFKGVPERQIREELDFLSAEGHVYSTIDDDHFRATEA